MDFNENQLGFNMNDISIDSNVNFCPECGLSVAKDCNKCLRCGTVIRPANTKKSKAPYIAIAAVVVLLCIVGIIGAIICIPVYFGDSTRVIENILEDSVYNNSTLEKELEISGDVSGASNNCSLVLLSSYDYGTKEYKICLVDKTNKTINEFEYEYTPLNIVLEDIFTTDLDLSIKIMELISAEEYVFDYGVDSFSNQYRAEEFFCYMTSAVGAVEKEYAQGVLNENLFRILPPVEDDIENYKILYEYGNANPEYYIHYGQTLVYNWSGTLPEDVYDTWKACTDKSTQDIMVSLYGPPYVFKTLWEAYDRDFDFVARTSESEQRLIEMLKK